jgi:hypothetical protein
MNSTEPDVLPESVEPTAAPLQYRVTEKPKPPLLNRVQRRALAKYIRHKAKLQWRRLLKHSNEARLAEMDKNPRCGRCGLYFFAWPHRCQCQALSHRQCAMCGAAFMASQQEWRRRNVCPGCAAQLREQRENEEASAAEAQQRRHDLRAWDDEQHREAQERAEVIQ